MPTLGPITLPPTPQPGGGPAEYRQRVDVWTRKCEQAVRSIERFLRDLDTTGGAANGLPVGGTSGQVLTKSSGVDYDAGWVTPHYVPAGGTAGQVLKKNSGTDYDHSWLFVTDAELSTSDITTNDVTSTKHGFAPKSPADATKFLNGAATPAYAQVKDSDLSTSDITTNDVTSTKHGFAPKSPSDATKFLNGAATPAYALVKDSDLSTSDITTNNVSTSKHGFAPKASGSVDEFLNGTGSYSTPAGSGDDATERSVMARSYAITNGSTTRGVFGNCFAAAGNLTVSSVSQASANQLACVTLTSANTTLGTVGSWQSSNVNPGGEFMFGHKSRHTAWVTPLDSTNVAYFFGVTDLNATNQMASDTPTGNYAGFRYSPSTASDTTWKAILCAGGSVEVIDTGVTVSNTTMVRLGITWDGTASNSFKFYIDGTLVATGSTNPSSTVSMKFMSASKIVTAGGATKSFRYAEQHVVVTYPS